MIRRWRSGLVAVVLGIAILLAVAPVALAAEPAEDSAIQPDVLIETQDQLVLSFGGEVTDKEAAVRMLDEAAEGIRAKSVFGTLPALAIDSSVAGGGDAITSTFTLSDSEQKDFGDSYTSTAFSTDVVAGSTTDVDGATSAVWYGSYPQSNAYLITTDVYDILDAGFWYRVPSGWSNNALSAHGAYQVWNAWYLTSLWDGLDGTGTWASSWITQTTTGVYYFDGGDTNTSTPLSDGGPL